jgi:hypothetical protein
VEPAPVTACLLVAGRAATPAAPVSGWPHLGAEAARHGVAVPRETPSDLAAHTQEGTFTNHAAVVKTERSPGATVSCPGNGSRRANLQLIILDSVGGKMATVESVLRDLKSAGEPIKHTAKELAELSNVSEDEARRQLADLNKDGLLKRKDDMSTKDSPVPLRVMGYLG